MNLWINAIMTSPALLILVPLLGVSFGYEPSTDAEEGYDYTVQVEPELLEQLRKGRADTIEANIPPEVTPIRRIRVVVGTDELPKKLRPGTSARATYRQDLDPASQPGIDLLAQTGPAGGFGRSATGFNGAATRGTTPPPSSTAGNPASTVPSIGTNYNAQPPASTGSAYDMRGQLEAGFQAAEDGLANTRDTVRSGVNNIGSTGQQFLDNTRQTLADVVAPPENRSHNPQNTPLENVGTRLQNEFQNTADAVRDAYGRTSTNARDAFGGDRYNLPADSLNAGSQPPPQWSTNNLGGDPLRTAERSVLINSGGSDNLNATNNSQSESEQQFWLRQRELQAATEQAARERAQREQQLAAATGQSATSSGNGGPQFPMQPLPNRELPARDLPNREFSNRDQPNVVTQMVDRSTLSRGDNRQSSLDNTPGISATGSSGPLFADPYARNPGTGLGDSATDLFPTIGQAPAASNTATAQSVSRPDVGGWAPEVSNNANEPQPETAGTGLPAAVWAWAIALGLGVANLFQWLNIVDMRNKYRVALRRNSPNFARSMAA